MTVLGPDGCKGGWVAVAADGDGFVDVFVARDVTEAEAIGLERWGIDTIVIDMPIGLADRRPRRADALARDVLGKRRASVFNVPIRCAVEADSRVEADRLSRAADCGGVGSMSYALCEKIREVDAYLEHRKVVVREGHPEVSFLGMAGKPMDFYKKTLLGALERRAHLDKYVLAPPMEAEISLSKAAFDDIHDAAAMAWTALRVARGEEASLPEEPEVFSDGWPSAIWY
jgi:predicted RNase H-like nuclease